MSGLTDDLNPEVVKATAQFIGKITGLTPPPHDAFPSEWHGYLRAFTGRLREIASENADQPAAETATCKLCQSTGPDVPCAYPTEINRQQAQRIVELETMLASRPAADESARDTTFPTILMSAAAKSGDEGAIRLAAQLAGAAPCAECGFVNYHCKCAADESAKPVEGFNEYRRGLMEAFHLANTIGANPQGRTPEETIRYMVRSLADLANATAPVASKEAVTLSDATRDVTAERERQVTVEGWTPEHDDEHGDCEMALAAIVYAESAVGYHIECPDTWPWSPKWFKPTTPRRDLVKAGALILAEIERIDRAAQRDASKAEPKS